jgi:hypothetical protein
MAPYRIRAPGWDQQSTLTYRLDGLSFSSSSCLHLLIILPFSRKGEDSALHGFDTRLLLTPTPLSLSPSPPLLDFSKFAVDRH